MFSRILKFCYHCTVYAIGIFVLLAAVLVTLIRLALPDIGIYRSEIEAWVTNYMDYPVVIRSLDATWQGWVPELYLTRIDLLNRAGTHPITRFDSARVQIDPIATLKERRIIPRSLIISGFNLTVAHLTNGAIYIEGIKLDSIEGRDTNAELAEWLSMQDEIKIVNANILWRDIKNDQDPIQLSDVNVELRNDVGRFQVEGTANLPEEYGGKMNFAFDAFGNLLTTDWSGEMYVASDQINPDNWYRRYRPPAIDITGGSADIKVWSNWDQGQLNSFEGQLNYEDFQAISDQKSLHVQALSYNFSGMKNKHSDWNFQLQLNEFQTENGYWPGTDISFDMESIDNDEENGFRYFASFSYLKLDDFSPLINDFSIFPEQLREHIADISFNGELKDGTITYDPQKPPLEQISIDVNFDNLASDFNNELPSFTGLTGSIQGSLAEGTMTLHDRSTDLFLPSMEIEKLTFHEVDGDIQWWYDGGAWELSTNSLNVRTDDFPAMISGKIMKQDTDKEPFFDVIVEMQEMDAENIAYYVPYTDAFRLRDWLQRSVAGGKLQSVSTLLRGYLGDFPFDNNEGRFQLIADVSNGTLDYSEFWPVVDQIDVEIIIDGRVMTANVQNGSIFDASITDATAQISNMFQQWKTLNINGNIQGNTHDLKLFIDQSPLQNNQTLMEVGTAITTGNINIDLDLGIPLKYRGQRPDKLSDINGHIYFADTSIESPAMQLAIHNINGGADFTRTTIDGEDIVGQYMDTTVGLALSGDTTSLEHPPTIMISGNNDHAFIIDRLAAYVPATDIIKDYLMEHSSGNTDWSVSLGYPKDPETNTVSKRLTVDSNLSGMALDLPQPFNKTAREIKRVHLKSDMVITGIQEMDLNFGEQITGRLEMNRDTTPMLQHIALGLGDHEMEATQQGFPVRGEINQMSVSEWLGIIGIVAARSQKPHPILEYIDLDIDIARLDVFDLDYENVNARISKESDTWLIKLDSKKLKGDISLPSAMGRDRIINMDMERLYLVRSNKTETEDELDPGTLPSIIINADDFRYIDREMGSFQLNAATSPNGLSVDSFQFTKEAMTIHGDGHWYALDDREVSNFNIILNADHMDAMLQTFGYGSSPVDNGETSMTIAANWQGSPMDFRMDNLNGTLTMNIRDGSFVKIDPAAGRLFGLLSIQTLPRRLLLDFTDIFGKGLRFDNIEGNFDITDGNAYTNNLYMAGPAAEIAVSGRTGLADQDYDQVVTVTPQIAGTLPVASAIFGPVGIGVGAVMYLFNSINNNIDKMLQAKYTITGSWEDPVVEKIKVGDVVADG